MLCNILIPYMQVKSRLQFLFNLLTEFVKLLAFVSKCLNRCLSDVVRNVIIKYLERNHPNICLIFCCIKKNNFSRQSFKSSMFFIYNKNMNLRNIMLDNRNTVDSRKMRIRITRRKNCDYSAINSPV